MKKGKISSIIGLLFASSFLIRTVVIHQMRASKKQESEKIAAVQEFIKSQENRLRQKSKRILLRVSLEMDQELLNQDLATTKPYLLIINTILVFETEPIIY